MSEPLELEHLIGSAASKKRGYLEATSAADTKRSESFRESLASYRKQLTPMLFMETVQIGSSQGGSTSREVRDIGIVRHAPRRKLQYQDSVVEGEDSAGDLHKKRPKQPKQKQNWDSLNTQHRLLKLSSEVKQLRREVIEDTIKDWKRPANLEYELRKKRFFETFQLGSAHSHSYSSLARKFRLNY